MNSTVSELVANTLLVVGALFGAHGLGLGLALTGAIYLAATALFLLFAPALRARGAQPSSS